MKKNEKKKAKKEDVQYYYFLEKLEREYKELDYGDLAKEFNDNDWEFHGSENDGEVITYRWQYAQKQFVNVRVNLKTDKIIEVIL